jgi:hypothetical protein
MKHLKRFSESSSYEEELKDFCEGCLAYLLDEDFSVFVTQGASWTATASGTSGVDHHKNVMLKKEGGKSVFTWNSVKDYYIPFVQLLKKKYELDEFFTRAGDKDLYVQFFVLAKNNFSENYYEYTTLEKVITDDVPVTERIWMIMIKVKDNL